MESTKHTAPEQITRAGDALRRDVEDWIERLEIGDHDKKMVAGFKRHIAAWDQAKAESSRSHPSNT